MNSNPLHNDDAVALARLPPLIQTLRFHNHVLWIEAPTVATQVRDLVICVLNGYPKLFVVTLGDDGELVEKRLNIKHLALVPRVPEINFRVARRRIIGSIVRLPTAQGMVKMDLISQIL